MSIVLDLKEWPLLYRKEIRANGGLRFIAPEYFLLIFLTSVLRCKFISLNFMSHLDLCLQQFSPLFQNHCNKVPRNSSTFGLAIIMWPLSSFHSTSWIFNKKILFYFFFVSWHHNAMAYSCDSKYMVNGSFLGSHEGCVKITGWLVYDILCVKFSVFFFFILLISKGGKISLLWSWTGLKKLREFKKAWHCQTDMSGMVLEVESIWDVKWMICSQCGYAF